LLAAAVGRTERLLFTIAFWLSPWQLYFAGHVWNANWLVPFGVPYPSRRKATTRSIRSPAVCRGSRRGRDERSTSPASPSTRYRPNHRYADRSLIPIAAATFFTRHTCSTIDLTSTSRLAGQLRAF
jgi:hypothetical protein